MNQVPLEDQIRALLSGRAFEFTRAVTGKSALEGSEYAEVFTVSREDVHAFVRERGLPREGWSAKPQAYDGVYMVEADGRYTIYYQERGVRFDEVAYVSRTEAEGALTDLLLGMSGTGLFVAHPKRPARILATNLFGRIKSALGLRA